MRLIKILSLTAVAAVIAIAFVGTGSASASVKKVVLCKVSQKLCALTNLWGSEVTIKALSPLTVLLGGLAVECHAAMTVLAQTSDSDRILGKITSLVWTNCKGCTSVVTTTLPTFSLFHTSEGSGLLLTTSLTTILVAGCLFEIECTKLMSDASLTFLGGTIGGTAKIHANEVFESIHGGLCGSAAKWDAQDGLGVSKSFTITEVNGAKAGEIWISLESHA